VVTEEMRKVGARGGKHVPKTRGSAMTFTCCCSYCCSLVMTSKVVVSGEPEAHMLSLQVIKKTLIARKRSYNRSVKGEASCLRLLARLARTKT
jgi:hypothetical protein